MTPDQILEVLEEKLALQAWCDPRDAKTDRERTERAALSATLSRDVAVLKSHPRDIANLDARLAPLRAAHKRLLTVKATLEARTPSLHGDVEESLDVLTRGVPYVDDAPIFPASLRALLTDACPHCGNESFKWLGSIDVLAAQIADLEKRRDYFKRHLDAALTPREMVTS